MRDAGKEDARFRGRLVKVQALSSRIPPVRAVAVAGNLYKPHACLQEQCTPHGAAGGIGKVTRR